MAIFELFSKRQKRLRGEMPDVYVYDDLPYPLRVQIVHIWKDTLYQCESIVNTLCREYGVFRLAETGYSRDYDRERELFNFF